MHLLIIVAIVAICYVFAVPWVNDNTCQNIENSSSIMRTIGWLVAICFL